MQRHLNYLLMITMVITASCATNSTERPDMTVRQIDISQVFKTSIKSGGSVFKPAVINDDDDLASIFTDEEVHDYVSDQVDLSKETVLFFSWSGSGRDKLDWKIDTKENSNSINFIYSWGKTKDLRGHSRLFAIPKGTEWNVIRNVSQ